MSLHRWLIIGYIAAQALDIGTTAYRLHQGCREAVWVNAPTAYAAKGAGIGVVIAFKDRHPTATAVISSIGIASGVYGTAHNLRLVCQ